MTNPSRVTLLQRKRKRKRRSSSSSSQKWIPTIMKKSMFLLLMIVPTFVLIINSMRFNYNNNNGDNKILFDDEDHSNNYEDGGIRNFDSPTVSKDNIRKLSSSLSSSSSSSLRSPTIIISTETDNSNTANGASSTINPKDSEVLTDNKVKVFIGIKTAATKYKTTSSKQHHGSQRLPQITSTWLHDVVKRKDQIDLKFFASKLDLDVFANGQKEQSQKKQKKQNSTTTTNKSDPPPNIIDFNSEESINKWFIQTPEGCNQHCCKGEMMFKYYLNKYGGNSDSSDYSPWFCSFDDDNYILIDNLLQVLSDFERNNETATDNKKIYVGRTSLNAIFKQQYMSSKNIRYIQFLTGGAGYCISKRLMIDGSQIYKEYGRTSKKKRERLNGFLNFTKYCDINHLPDDVSIGLWINTDLQIKQIIHPLFHSHLEINLKKELPVDDIYKQVSFGYDNKIHHGGTNVPEYFPNIPIIVYDDNKDDDDDPMLFKSLRKFIHEQQKQKQKQ